MNEYMRMADRMYDLENQMKQLEKENAELKELLKDKSCLDCNHLHSDLKLTKAKEIIKTFLGFAEAFSYSPSMDKFISEAEQFLSEVEK